jgi:hypothetical protein
VADEIKELRREIVEQGRKIDTILKYLNDDPHTNQSGLVAKVNEHDRKLIEMKVAERVGKERNAVLGGFVGGIVSIIVAAVNYIIKSNQ